MKDHPMPRIPVSTYRLQFNNLFRFSDAMEIIPYLHDLGISDIYSSPYLKAIEGSTHGYDIVYPNALNPEVGSDEEYNAMVDVLRKHGMGQILDIVPNHMGIASKENIYWMDVLENGPSAIYAAYFDIDWVPVKKELEDKILLPALGDQYGTVLENQELQLVFDEGSFCISYYELRLPVRPKTYADILNYRIEKLNDTLAEDDPNFLELLSIITGLDHLPPYTEKDMEKINERYREKEIIKKRIWNLYTESPGIKSFIDENVRIFNGTRGESGSFDLLDSLLSKQGYRLSHWRVATEEINYRRFFDINELAAIRMEDINVFMETHNLILEMIREGKVTGLRIDHSDGLYNPSEYFYRLQKNCFLQMSLGSSERQTEKDAAQNYNTEAEATILKQYDDMISSDPQYKPFYIVGEKILAKGERIPEDWHIFSTTGYAFMNLLNGIFVVTGNAKAFDDIYSRFIKSKANFQDIVYEKKKLIMQVSMSSEINTLGHYLNRLSEKDRHTRDFTLNSLIHVIDDVIAFFPVYRTYISSPDITERDRRYIELAISKAKRKNPAINETVLDFLRDVLLLKYPEDFVEEDKEEWIDFVQRFQQITGPVMAKGVEDTTFYEYNRLVSLNEVGGSPDRFGTPLETFHGQNIERIKCWPNALITTATHDSKRGEDVRARINVLSEIPYEWKERLIRWSRLNRRKKPVIDGQTVPFRNEEYLLYQTLVGTRPIGPMDNAGYEAFKARIKEYMLKATREAKLNTSWINPNPGYEDALLTFIEAIMEYSYDNQFLKDFELFQKKVSDYGIFNSLSQTLLKITSPGVPDFYQGTETWHFSLVDPDNRHPVDYRVRINMLNSLKKREAGIGSSELASELIRERDNGEIKLYLVNKALSYRRNNREIFEMGDYIPLESAGEKADNVCSFARKLNNSVVLVAAPRFYTELIQQPDTLPFGKEVWKDSFLLIPFEDRGARYRDTFTGRMVETATHASRDAATGEETAVLCLADIFTHFPVAMLERV